MRDQGNTLYMMSLSILTAGSFMDIIGRSYMFITSGS